MFLGVTSENTRGYETYDWHVVDIYRSRARSILLENICEYTRSCYMTDRTMHYPLPA